MRTARKVSENRNHRKSYHHAGLRDALIETALSLTVERDGPVFSLRELATALGVSHTSVYRHFADKDALLEEMTQMGFAVLVDAQKQAQAAAEDPVAQLRALCVAYIRFARDYPGYFSLMFDSRPSSDMALAARDRHNRGALDTLLAAIRACQESGDMIPGDAERIASYLVLAPHGMCNYIASGHVPGFIARQHADLDAAAEWMATIGLAPFLVRPMPQDQFGRLFFGTE